MKLVLFGEDIFTATVLQSLVDAKFKLQLIVCPFYENNNHKGIQRIAELNHIEFIREKNVNSEEIKQKVLNIHPDLIISVHLRKILSKEIFSLAKHGAVNMHPSLLPKYRGLSPQHQVLIHGDNESAVTIHYIEEGIDTGDIIIQQKFDIKPTDYIADVQLKMLAIYKTLMVDALKLLQSDNFKATKQSESDISYFGPLKKKDREININASTKEVYNLIRAVSMPYKGAFYGIYIIWSSNFIDSSKEEEMMKTYTENGIFEENNEDQNLNKIMLKIY
jgi:methionyl-tRNA formyltransferase